MVAVVVIVTAVFAAADLMGQLIVRTTKIGDQEQARSVAYQVAETARAYRCGQVYGTESDLADKVTACNNGLTAGGNKLGDCASGAGSGVGDTNLCWKVGSTDYDVAMTTGWDVTVLTPCPTSGTSTALPDTFVRNIKVRKAGTTTVLADVTVREAAPENPKINRSSLFFESGPVTVASNTIIHSITPNCGPPYPAAPSGSNKW